MENGISSKVPSPALYLEREEFCNRLKEHALQLALFEECIKGLDNLITYRHSFLLIDTRGTVLKKIDTAKKKKDLKLRKVWCLQRKAVERMQ